MPKVGKRFKITKRLIDRVERFRSTGRDVFMWDDEIRGFGVRLKASPSRAAAYLIQYRNALGATRRFKIGRVGGMTPDEARTEARRRLGEVDRGADPSGNRKKIASDPTVSELCDRYIKEGPAWRPGKRASTWMVEKSNIERHIKPLLGDQKQLGLEAEHIEKFQRDVKEGKTKADIKTKARGRAIVEGGTAAASRATAVLSIILAFAVAKGMRASNPALGVKREAIPKRQRFLSVEEIGKIGEAMSRIEAEGGNRTAINALRALLLTACRRTEITRLRWRNADLGRAMLHLETSKTGARAVSLGAAACKLFAALPRPMDSDGNDWVFPAARGDGPIEGLRRVWMRVLKRAKVAHARVHDLRHTTASVAAASGESLHLIGKLLGHRQSRTTETYAHVAPDPVRALADRTSARIAAALEGGNESNVVRLPRKKGTVSV